MTDPETPGRVFISYRRADTSASAGRLADHVNARFGKGTAFMDVDSIAPGSDFAEAIDVAVGSCDALLAVIGSGWSTAVSDEGRGGSTFPTTS